LMRFIEFFKILLEISMNNKIKKIIIKIY
jgi:hypothetical protein